MLVNQCRILLSHHHHLSPFHQKMCARDFFSSKFSHLRWQHSSSRLTTFISVIVSASFIDKEVVSTSVLPSSSFNVSVSPSASDKSVWIAASLFKASDLHLRASFLLV